jgi:parvulin-like peptidyl-prolyl isomerase
LVELLGNQYQQMAQQIQQQLSVVERQTVDTMIDDALIEAEAASRGITVSEEEVTEFINQTLARRLNGLTATAATETATARFEASATATLWTPTPTFTPSPTITATESVSPTATPADTPTPAPTATPNIIGAESLSTEYATWINVLAENVDLSEADYRQIIRSFIFRDKVAEALGEEVSPVAEQAHVRHILVETEEEAQAVLDRLEAGEDFADVAAEVSQDPGSAANGGDLGFLPRGQVVEPIEEAIFSLPVGQVSDPIQTQFGWHIVEVLEREERELSPVQYQQSQQLAFSEWLENARAEADIQNLWTADKAPPGGPLAAP